MSVTLSQRCELMLCLDVRHILDFYQGRLFYQHYAHERLLIPILDSLVSHYSLLYALKVYGEASI